MDKDFEAIATRAAALRLTVPELIDSVEGVSRPTYWRAKSLRTGTASRVRVLRAVENRLAAIEAERGMA